MIHQRGATPTRGSTGRAGRGVGPKLTDSTGTPTHEVSGRSSPIARACQHTLHTAKNNYTIRSSTTRIITTTIHGSADRLNSKAVSKKHHGAGQEESMARERSARKPSPHHLWRANCHGLQGGDFKKHTTPKRRHHPIRGSWIFIRSVEGRRRPLRRLQEGHDVRERRRRIPRGPRARVFPRQNLTAFYTGPRTSTSDTRATVTASCSPATMPPPWPRSPAST